jgi:hypothetical protein
MNFPGDNELKLSDDAVAKAFEDALNSTRNNCENPIRVISVAREYSYGPWRILITTDAPKIPVADVTTLSQVAA